MSILCGASDRAMPRADAGGAIFPRATGSNLEGREFDLPGDFEGRLNMVMVAFKREQQADVDTWLSLAKTLAARHPGLSYYELPVIYRTNALVRWFIDGGMRRGIPDPAARRSTVTLYLDKEEFRSALGIPHEDAIHVFLILPGGRVIWRAEGVLTDRDAMEVERIVSAHLGGEVK